MRKSHCVKGFFPFFCYIYNLHCASRTWMKNANKITIISIFAFHSFCLFFSPILFLLFPSIISYIPPDNSYECERKKIEGWYVRLYTALLYLSHSTRLSATKKRDIYVHNDIYTVRLLKAFFLPSFHMYEICVESLCR